MKNKRTSFDVEDIENDLKPKETWKDINDEYCKEHPPFSGPYPRFEDWLKDNYNPPTRKSKRDVKMNYNVNTSRI